MTPTLKQKVNAGSRQRVTKVNPTARQKKAAAVPPPPEWMANKFAIEEWYRLAPILIERGQLNETSIGAFSQLCALHGRIASFRHVSEDPTSAMLLVYQQWLKAFGLWPTKPK